MSKPKKPTCHKCGKELEFDKKGNKYMGCSCGYGQWINKDEWDLMSSKLNIDLIHGKV